MSPSASWPITVHFALPALLLQITSQFVASGLVQGEVPGTQTEALHCSTPVHGSWSSQSASAVQAGTVAAPAAPASVSTGPAPASVGRGCRPCLSPPNPPSHPHRNCRTCIDPCSPKTSSSRPTFLLRPRPAPLPRLRNACYRPTNPHRPSCTSREPPARSGPLTMIDAPNETRRTSL